MLLVSGLITAAIHRLHPRRLVRVFADVALAATGGFFAFPSPVVGGMGVAVTGSTPRPTRPGWW